MAAFRILNQFPVYLDLAGKPADGGYLAFYESGTTTPKSVYGGPDLTPDNGSTVGIGSDGRTEVDVWGDGAYRVRLYDADDTLIAEADDVEIAGGDASTIPTLVDGYFLTNNGSLLLWAAILQLPDPTGQDGKMVVADGDGYILQSVPEPPEPVDPEIVVGDASFQAGVSDDNTKFYVQRGTGSATATGTQSSSAAISFPVEFGVAWQVVITPTISSCTPNGGLPQTSVTGLSTTGCTANFYTGDEDNGGSSNRITSAINFSWIAFGTIEVAPPEA